jgi:hypothetical protein
VNEKYQQMQQQLINEKQEEHDRIEKLRLLQQPLCQKQLLTLHGLVMLVVDVMLRYLVTAQLHNIQQMELLGVQ